jgi:hypothetical protein
MHLGEQTGERFTGSRGKAVRSELVDLANLGVEFVADDDGTELTVESADRVELLVQKCDGRAVDAPGGVDKPAQFVGGILALVGNRLRRCEEGRDGLA